MPPKEPYHKPEVESIPPDDPRAREALRREMIDQLTAVKSDLLQTVVELSGLIARLENKPKLAPPRILPAWRDDRDR